MDDLTPGPSPRERGDGLAVGGWQFTPRRGEIIVAGFEKFK